MFRAPELSHTQKISLGLLSVFAGGSLLTGCGFGTAAEAKSQPEQGCFTGNVTGGSVDSAVKTLVRAHDLPWREAHKGDVNTTISNINSYLTKEHTRYDGPIPEDTIEVCIHNGDHVKMGDKHDFIVVDR